MQLFGQNLCHLRRRFGRRRGIKEQSTRAPGQNIFDRSGHLLACSPDDLRFQIRKSIVKQFAKAGLRGRQFFNFFPVGAKDSQMRRRRKRFGAAATPMKGQCRRSFLVSLRGMPSNIKRRGGSGLWIVGIFLVYSRKPHRRHSSLVIAYCVCWTHFRRLTSE